ncbi:MAG: hypothetical protein Q8R34_02240, partial [bacterium]|nr:hypothetical protein [bacterium]
MDSTAVPHAAVSRWLATLESKMDDVLGHLRVLHDAENVGDDLLHWNHGSRYGSNSNCSLQPEDHTVHRWTMWAPFVQEHKM